MGDYDKFEYDIRLKSGEVVENCYPNAGVFNSISDVYDGEGFSEDLVEEIRFSKRPRFGINDNVSSVSQEDVDKLIDHFTTVHHPQIREVYKTKGFVCKGRHEYRQQADTSWVCQCGKRL